MGTRTTHEDFLTSRLNSTQVDVVEGDIAELNGRDPYRSEGMVPRTFCAPGDEAAPVPRLLHLILGNAVTKGASHILMLPAQGRLEVAFCVVDSWKLELQPPFRLASVMAGLVEELCGSAGAMKVQLGKGRTVHALAKLRETLEGPRTLIRLVDVFN
jgi:hypothetical protein